MSEIDSLLFQENNTSDSNFNAKAKKIAWRKTIRKESRDEDFDTLITSVGGLPNTDEAVIIKTNGCSDTGSIFTYINQKETVTEVYLSTWIISRSNIERLLKCFDAGATLTFVVSKRLKELKKSDYAYLVEQFQKRKGIKYKVANCHAKTFSVKTVQGNHYTVTGSGNWTENPRIENYIITNDVEYFGHNKEWMEEVTNG